jgi:hypothetical protein
MNAYTSLHNLVDNYNLQDFEKKNVMNLITELIRTPTEDPRGETSEFRNLAVELRKNVKAATIALEVIRDYDRCSSSILTNISELTNMSEAKRVQDNNNV